jgi:hypothetical protein
MNEHTKDSIVIVTSENLDGANVTYQTVVDKNIGQKDIFSLVDKIHKSILRQRKWNRLSVIEKNIADSFEKLSQFEFQLASMQQKHDSGAIRAGEKSSLSGEISATKDHILRFRTLIETYKREAVELEHRLSHDDG